MEIHVGEWERWIEREWESGRKGEMERGREGVVVGNIKRRCCDPLPPLD